jgi:uncharacterized membrane protein
MFRPLARALFPPARRGWGWRAAWPLVGFVCLFVLVCLAVELSGTMRFTRRWPFVFAAAFPWIWWMSFAGGAGSSATRRTSALLLRLLLAACFVILLAEPRAVRRSDALAVVYALDISDSIGREVSDRALSWVIETAGRKPPKDEAGLIVFARDAAVELPPRQAFPFEAINARVARDASNIARALSLAAAILPEEKAGRIVLVSDGNETDGSASAQIEQLRARGIPVDVLPIGFDFAREVWLERIDLPRMVKAGETYEASVILNALQAGRGTLKLRENGNEIFSQEVAFNEGKNRFTLPIYLRAPGYYEYVASIEVAKDEDGWRENNVAMGEIYLRGEGRILLVIDPAGDRRDWETFASALRESKRVVEIRPASEFAHDAISLLPFEAIVFANVPSDAFDPVQFDALRDAVYHQGSGFLMLGGPQSFGPGGYHRTAVEEVLPVSMDVSQKKVLPKGALAIVLHTCEFAEGNTWAKRIAKESIRVLGAQDEVGLLAFGRRGDEWVFPLTPAGQYKKLAVLINEAEPGDMGSFQTSMQMALEALRASDAASKHLIVISDGDPSPPTPELVQAYIDAKITASMVAINPHGGRDISIMHTIASATGGRYYLPQDPAELPSIFIKEAKKLKRAMVQNVVFTPQVDFPSTILRGLDSLPPLRGFVLTTPKPRANVILRAPPPAEAAGEIDPVLATWRFGLGSAAAWTSDLAPSWAVDWVGWEKYRAFVGQLLTEISRVESKSDLHMQTFASGGQGIITVEDFAEKKEFLDLTARVSGPRGDTINVPLRQIDARRYEGTFPLWGKGRYRVLAAGAGNINEGAPRNAQAVAGFVVPYSAEYLRFQSNPILLKQIATATSGRVLTAAQTDLFHSARLPRESSRPVFDWFLVTLAILLPLDVAVRRVQLDWQLLRGWFRRGTSIQDEVTSALLERKKQTREALAARRVEAPMVGVPPPPAAKIAETSEAPAPLPREPNAAGTSTTEQLLARKRRRRERDNPSGQS